MADDPPAHDPEREQEDPLLGAADDGELSAIWLGAEGLPSAREALPAIAAVESDGPSSPQPSTVEEHKSEQEQELERQVDESEVYFLIADFLKRRSTCHKAADTLIQEMAEHKLLKGGVDWTGRPKAATYEDYRLRHRDISAGHLVELLQGAATAFPRLNVKKEVDEKVKDAPTEQTNSLLLRARVKQQLKLTLDERKKLAKDIVGQLMKLRAVLKTLRVVEKVIKKYERYQKYTTAKRVEDLPPELQLMMLGGDAAVKTDSDATDKVTTLAADVRALKQLFQLRQERTVVEKQIETLMDRAKRSGLFQTTARTGRNQASLLRRREVCSRHDSQLPPAYVYSRIRRLKTLSGHLQIQAYCLAYDKLGKVVITGSDDRLVKIWSLRTGDLLFTLRGHVGNITDLAVNHSNTLLASSSDDKTVRVWEISTGAPIAVLVGHSSVVNAVRFHPTKNIVVTASDDGRCFCYKVPEIPLMDQPETKIETARRLYSLDAYMLSLHPLYAMKHARREGVRSCKVHCVTFSRCGDFVASGGHDGIARVWDLSMVSAPDAPAVVPRFQPTDVPQEARVQEQQPSGNGLDVLPPVTIPVITAPGTQVSNAAPATLQLPLVQQSAGQVNGMAAPNPSEPFRAMVTSTQPLPLGQGPLQPQLPLQFQPPMQPQAPLQSVPLQPVPVQPVPLQPQVPLQPVPVQPQVPVQSQGDVELPLPTVAEALQRDAAPRQTQPPQVQNNLPSLSLSDDDVPSIEPIALLKGHKGPVSSIVYNYRGDRIVTASIKDSAARVWKWKRKYKSLHAAVLLAKESSVEHDDISVFYGVRGRRKAAPVVDTVAWTHDDKRLITLHSVKLNSESADPTWEQRIRIWEPETGKLLMTLGAIDKEKKNGHVNAAFALSAHPKDWRIVVTAGYDGRVFVWDISTGRMLKAFTNLSPDSKPLSNLDGGFTPDGSGFCFTDQIGRLLIFGTGSGEQYAATPVQQYFLHDYVMLVTDGHYNVRDRETQELPSLMDSGPLMDASLVQYPHQPPHLLVNSVLTLEQYEENRRLRIQQSKESEIQCAVRHLPEAEEDSHSFPFAVVKGEVKKSPEPGAFAADAMAVARASYRLSGAPVMLSELRRRGSGSRRYADPRRRRRETPADERDTSVLELEISSEDDRSDEDFQVPTPRHAAEEEEEDDDEEEEDDDDLDEDDLLSDNETTVISPANSRRRRLRSTRQQESPRARFPVRGGRRLQSSSEEDDLEDTPRQLRTRRNAARSRSRLIIDSDGEEDGDEVSTEQRVGGVGGDRDPVNRDGQGEVVIESNDGIIMDDNQLDRFDPDITYTAMLEAKRAQLGTAPVPAENSTYALIQCAFCGSGDDGAMLKLPGDGMGVHPLIFGATRVFVHDQCAIASPLCFNRDGNWYNVTREIRRGRSLTCVGCNTRGATIGCTVAACRNSYHWKCAINFGWSVDQMHFFCPDHQSRRAQRHRQEVNRQVAAEDGGAIIEPASIRFGLKFHREWLQLISLRSIHQYVPQVGDYVVYLPEGHPGYLRYGGMPHPRYYARLSKFYAVKCRVVDVKYVFPTAEEHVRCSTIKCELSLAVLAVPTSAVRPASDAEEKAQEEESKEGVASDTANLFNPESSQFAEFTSVDEQLSPAASEPSARFNFKVLYHSNDVANFLVLDHIYESGVCGNWHIGDRVQMPFVQLNEHGLEVEAKMSYGTIESILRKPLSTSTLEELSPWECVTVNWDEPEDDICAVCPWELESASADERREKRQLSLRRRSTRLFFSRSIIGEKCEALLQEVDQVLTLSLARDFMYPVDEENFMDYPISIANPIDLTKIQQRLRMGYYRQVEAFLADVKLLSINCETYNISSSSIAQNSRNLFSAVLTQAQRHFPHLIRDVNNTNRREVDGERANASYSYPPDDFLSTFSEDPEGVQLELLEIGLLTRAPEDPSNISAEPVADRVEGFPEVGPPVASEVQAGSPQTRSRRRTRSSEETKENDATEEKVDHALEQDGETTVDTASSPQSTMANTVDGPASVFNSPRQLRSREVVESQFQSPRARRTPRVVTTPPTGGGGPARKRQRKNPDQELLTYSALMEKYTSTQREDIKRACDEDLRAVLQEFHGALTEADQTDIFAFPVTDDVAPRYSEIIAHPMDFGTIQDKLHKCRSFRDYFAHVELVFSNAITYNTWDCFIGGLVEDLQKYCVKFLLDAVGVNLKGNIAPATKKAARTPSRSSNSKSKSSPAPSGKQRVRRSSAPVISEDEEDSWHSSTSESEEDDDEDDDDEEEEDFSDESDYGGAGRKRRLRRHAQSPKSKKKKAKRRY